MTTNDHGGGGASKFGKLIKVVSVVSKVLYKNGKP